VSKLDHHYGQSFGKKLSRNCRALNTFLWSGDNVTPVVLVVGFFTVVLNLDTLRFAIEDFSYGGPAGVVERYELRQDLDDYADDFREDLPIKDSSELTIVAISVDDVTLRFRFTIDVRHNNVDPNRYLARWRPRMVKRFCSFESYYRFMGRGAVMEWIHGDRSGIGIASDQVYLANC
jgi:hypothetical protein